MHEVGDAPVTIELQSSMLKSDAHWLMAVSQLVATWLQIAVLAQQAGSASLTHCESDSWTSHPEICRMQNAVSMTWH